MRPLRRPRSKAPLQRRRATKPGPTTADPAALPAATSTKTLRVGVMWPAWTWTSDPSRHGTFREAEAHNGPALIIAYSHCIAHGFPLHLGVEQQKLAVETGYWPLFRYNPALALKGEPGLRLDSGVPKGDVGRFMANETRFGILKNVAPERAAELKEQEVEHARSAGPEG